MAGLPPPLLLLGLLALSAGVCRADATSEEAPAFLGAELPLRILSVLPASRRPSQSAGTRLGGRAAITVVYSRAVIALGADWSAKGNDGRLPKELVPFRLEACEGQPAFAVPGKIRWSTTAIARFDPDVDWPSDLCFRLVVNPELRTFDGLRLALDDADAARWLFTTRHVVMSLYSVRSDKAEALTGGTWTSRTFDNSHGGHECPPDAIVRLSFSSDLDHSTAFAALQDANAEILPSKGDDAYEACGRRCLAVRPRGLEAGQPYQLVFPKGSSYGRISGVSSQEQHVSLVGLLPFAFPFWFKTPPAHAWENRKLRYRRHLLYLRHGLEATKAPGAAEAQLQALKVAITVADGDGASLDYALSRRDNATLQLETFKLEPSKRYKLEVRGTDAVRDGFGQPLQSGSMEFDTDDWPDGFVQAEDSPAYFRRSPGNWTVLARGKGNSWCARPASGGFLPPPMPNPPPLLSAAPAPAMREAPAPTLRELSSECQQHPYEVRAWPVRVGEIVAALAQRFNQGQSFLPAGEGLKARAPLVDELRPVQLEEGRLLLGGAVGKGRSGFFLRELWTSEQSAAKGFVSVAPFGVTFVGTANGDMLVWAADFAAGESVTGAAVTVYRLEKGYDTQLADVTRVAEGTTGKDGLVTLVPSDSLSWHAPGNSYAQLVAVVEAPDGTLAYSEAVPVPREAEQEKRTRAEMVTDRSIYRPGDTVHIKGYIRTLNVEGTGYELPDEVEASFSFEVQWKRSTPGHADADKLQVKAPLVAKYGTVSAELHVPSSDDEVSYGGVAVSLVRTPSAAGARSTSVASTVITVADPRPPTVTLNISTGAKVILPGPAASLDVDVLAATYSGTGVEGAEVELTWKLRRASEAAGPVSGEVAEVVGMASLAAPSPATDGLSISYNPQARHSAATSTSRPAEGRVTVVTGHLGKGSAVLSLAALLEEAGKDNGPAPPCAEGDELSLSARWVGPTREVVRAQLEDGPLRVARSPYVLALTPSRPVDEDAGTPLPGTPFAVYVDVRDGAGKSLEGMEVSLSLHEWNGSAAVYADPTAQVPASASDAELRKAALRPGLQPVETWGRQVGGGCAAKADGGKEAQCNSTLTLPEAKKYVVLARARDPEGVELVTAFAVGRTASEWKKSPLASLDETVTVRTDKSSYAVGDVVKLSMASPFQDPTALLVWGNGASRQSRRQKLAGAPGEPHVLELKLGEECAYGCNALLLLAAPDQPRGAVLPVKVPVSPLLDVTLPRSIIKHVQINVPDTERAFVEGSLHVVVAKRGGGDEPAAVLQPGAEAEVRVSAPESAAGAEVCLFVVDRAMLDVGGAAHPHPPAELAESFELHRGESFDVDDTRSGLASVEGYRQTVAAAVRRAAVDPWAWDTDWPLRRTAMDALAPVEQSDKEYFADHADQATHFPGPGLLGGVGGGMIARGMPMFKSKGMPMALAAMAEPQLESAPEMDVAAMAAPAPAPPATTPMPNSARHRKRRGRRGGGGQLGKSAFTRTQFETTPLFKASAVVGKDGTVLVPFKLPDNIATFEVRAYIVDGAGEHKFGRAETSFIARRDVSLVPAVPRVVRPGDRFECGVSVTGHAPQEAGGTGLPDGGVAVTAQIVGANASVALRKAEMVAFKASQDGDGLKSNLSSSGKGGSPQEVIFPFEAPSPRQNGSLGVTTLRFTAALRSGEVADGLEAKLAVKPLQAPVLVATSLSIEASSSGMSEASEGLELPDAMPGSGQLALTAGVGHLPAVIADSASLLGRHMNNGQVLAASLVPAAALAAYFPPGAWADASNASGLEAASAAFREAAARLSAYTDSAGQPPLGLVWRPEDALHRFGGYTPRASVSMNSFGVIVAHLVSRLAGSPLAPPASSGSSFRLVLPEPLTTAWKDALWRELQREVLDLHYHSRPRCRSDCFTSWETLAQARAALGFGWQASNAMVAKELSMDRLFSKTSLDSLSPLGLAYAALAYTLHASPGVLQAEAAQRLDDVYGRLVARLRVQGRTAYVASSPESPHSAGLEANAVVLLALARAGAPALARHFADNAGASLAARLAAYVADGGGAGRSVRFGGGEWMAPREAALAVAALAAFDVAHGSARPDLRLSASSGAISVLTYEARVPGAPPAAASLPWDSLARPPKPLRFEASGKGQVSVVAAMTFVPASAPTEGAVYRGIYVEKVVRRMDAVTGEPTGEALDLVKLGESVVVTIQVTTPDDLGRVTLQDLSAGGLEPVDPKVAGDVAGSSASGGCGGPYGWSWWCFPAFRGRETYADRVTWSSGERLPAGTHSVSYQAVAATRGVFSLPPAHAFAEDQPELMGLSQAGTLVITDGGCGGGSVAGGSEESPDAVLQRLGVQPSRRLAPRGCPGGCPHGGVCQLTTGKCGCYQGFSLLEGDCPAPAAAAPADSAQEALKDAVRLFLQGSSAPAGGSGWPLLVATVSACAVAALLAAAVGMSRVPHWLGRGSSARFAPCREQPYTSMEMMEQQ